MNTTQIKRLFDAGLISEENKAQLNAMADKKVFSLYYELRTLLYIGVLLFSGGVSILIYNNLGQLGHYLAFVSICIATIGCFYYVTRHQLAFSKRLVESENPYFDYALLLGSLFFISTLGYIQFLFGWFTNHISIISLISALVFFYLAYRHDHLGVLSLAITAMAAFWGLAISPMKWYEFNFPNDESVQWVAINYGIVIFLGALVLQKYKIKPHFTKTYLNFGIIIALTGSTTMLFSGNQPAYLLATIQIMAAAFIAWYSYQQRTVLYIIYGYVFGFIALSYALFNMLKVYDVVFWLLYTIGVCAGFIVVLLRLRNTFKYDS
jgi:hypothetical protein